MLPRKRQRPNPATVSSCSLPTTAVSPETSLSRASSVSEQAAGDRRRLSSIPTNSESGSPSVLSIKKEVRKTNSWYGSWPRVPKASASTSVAKENILGGTVKSKGTSDLSRFEARRSDDTASLHSNMGATPRSSQLSENNSTEPIPHTKQDKDDALLKEHKRTPETKSASESQSAPESQQVRASQSAPEPNKGDENTPDESAQTTPQQQVSTGGWLGGWWYKSPSTETPVASNPESGPEPPKEEDRREPQQETKQEDAVKPSPPPEQNPPEQTPPPESPSNEPVPDPPPSTSWFGFWYSTPQPNTKPDPKEADPAKESSLPKEQDTAKPSSPKEQDPTKPSPSKDQNATKPAGPPKGTKPDAEPKKQPENAITKDASPQTPQAHSPPPKAGSTWAFWSRDSPKTKENVTTPPESGEIAVIGEGSETQPKPMAEADVSTSPPKEIKDDSETQSIRSGWRRRKRLRPQSMDVDAQRSSSMDSTKTVRDQSPAAKPQQVVEQTLPLVKVDSKRKSTPETKKAPPVSETSAKQPPNLLLPSFTSTYQMKENRSILKQITNLVLRTSQSPPNHVFRIKDPPKIRKAIAIGVHGLFPATYLRPMIGQPTGTSLRFANFCADAIRRWADNHGCSDCEIEKVALEGEGRINDRVENLWKLMLNWVEQIRQADLILIACHSQGVPVSIMLLEKLIDLGVVSHAKIGVCAMAGVALGPFPDYKSSILMGSAAELWEFGNPQSNNSKRFEACLKRVLDYGARITFIGSIDDQLVPMESAVYSPANHPYIYRAVFIDGRIHAPDFIAHLVGFALKLRNLGISDHGLVRELSVALAGSLYSGEGHSRLYYDDAVYDLAVMHALETTNTAQPTPCVIPPRESTALASPNPYVLPWIMRGLLEEDYVKTQLNTETDKLLQQFDEWKPTNKALKDVKYRLEAVRSKL